jgi:hypothetical protein
LPDAGAVGLESHSMPLSELSALLIPPELSGILFLKGLLIFAPSTNNSAAC